jgi:hypothetical protein
VIGSGFLTHGLPFLRDFRLDAPPPGWSRDFDLWAAEALARGDVEHRHRRLLPGAGQALGPGRLNRRPSGRQAMARAAAERAQPQDRPTPVPPWP